MCKEKFKEGLFLELVLINWFIYFRKAYHKSFPKTFLYVQFLFVVETLFKFFFTHILYYSNFDFNFPECVDSKIFNKINFLIPFNYKSHVEIQIK